MRLKETEAPTPSEEFNFIRLAVIRLFPRCFFTFTLSSRKRKMENEHDGNFFYVSSILKKDGEKIKNFRKEKRKYPEGEE